MVDGAGFVLAGAGLGYLGGQGLNYLIGGGAQNLGSFTNYVMNPTGAGLGGAALGGLLGGGFF